MQNKHTESIAKAKQVPHRPQQIEICNHYFGALFNKEQLELLRPLIVFLFHYLMFQTCYVTLHMEACYRLSFQLSFTYKKTVFEQRAITHENLGQPWRKSNLICNSSYGSLLQTFIQICESIAEKSPENDFWAKGNNSWKIRSTVTKVELDL